MKHEEQMNSKSKLDPSIQKKLEKKIIVLTVANFSSDELIQLESAQHLKGDRLRSFSQASEQMRLELSKEKVFKLDKQRIVLGSVISADVRLSGEGVSPIHAVIELIQPQEDRNAVAVIYDLASSTGVYVNDCKVVTEKLNNGDQIRIGKYRVRYSLQNLNDNLKDRIREIEGRTLFLNPNEDFTPLLLEDEREVEEIFDYRPTSKKALEVVMSWNGTILDVEHFVDKKAITIGDTQKSDFGIPPLLSSSYYSIIVKKGDSFVLVLDSKMMGVIQKKGQLRTFDEIRNLTIKSPEGYEVPLEKNDFAKLSIGEIDFYFSYTAAPPRLKVRRMFDRDPFFSKVLVLSVLFTALSVYTILKTKILMKIEPEVPERIATILYQPEKFMTPPPPPVPLRPAIEKQVSIPPVEKPKEPQKKIIQSQMKLPEVKKPLPKVIEYANKHKEQVEKKKIFESKTSIQAKANPVVHHSSSVGGGKEGEGAKAKGPEGSRGDPRLKKNSARMTQISRPSSNSQVTMGSGASGHSAVSQEGNVDLLKNAGGRIQNILGNSAAGLNEGSQQLKGVGGFETGGSGGLALSGNGMGGGGNADTSLGGLGQKGVGLGRVSTGKGAAGHLKGIIGEHFQVALQADSPEEAVVMGAVDRDAVAEAIYSHKDEFRICYEREINADKPNLTGQVNTSFVIGSSGKVTQGGIESSSLNHSNVERCIISVLKRIQFPIPRGGGVVEVRFPFKFSARSK